jgi:hypothetical protein
LKPFEKYVIFLYMKGELLFLTAKVAKNNRRDRLAQDVKAADRNATRLGMVFDAADLGNVPLYRATLWASERANVAWGKAVDKLNRWDKMQSEVTPFRKPQ